MRVGLVAVAGLVCATEVATLLAADVAPPFSRVAVLLPACDNSGLTPSEVRSALALDLRDEGLALAPSGELSPGDVLVRIEATCTAGAELTLQAEFQHETRTRRVDLSELPPAQRARALSLSLAELLSQLGQARPPSADADAVAGSSQPAPTEAAPTEAAPTPAPAMSAKAPVQPIGKRPSEQHKLVEPQKNRRGASGAGASWQLGLAPELRFFRTTSLWGGRALGRYAAWSAGVDFLNARQAAAPGTVATLVLHASFAYQFTLLGGAGRSLLESGPRLGAGRTFMTARANPTARAANAQDVYLDAAFGMRYAFRLASSFRIGLGAELGYARGPIGYADNLEIARTAGPFASLMLDAAVQL